MTTLMGMRDLTFAVLDADEAELEALEETRLAVCDQYHDEINRLESVLWSLMSPAARAVYNILERVRWERGAELTALTFAAGRRRGEMLRRVVLEAERQAERLEAEIAEGAGRPGRAQ